VHGGHSLVFTRPGTGSFAMTTSAALMLEAAAGDPVQPTTATLCPRTNKSVTGA
jgi:hypothetical protein